MDSNTMQSGLYTGLIAAGSYVVTSFLVNKYSITDFTKEADMILPASMAGGAAAAVWIFIPQSRAYTPIVPGLVIGAGGAYVRFMIAKLDIS